MVHVRRQSCMDGEAGKDRERSCLIFPVAKQSEATPNPRQHKSLHLSGRQVGRRLHSPAVGLGDDAQSRAFCNSRVSNTCPTSLQRCTAGRAELSGRMAGILNLSEHYDYQDMVALSAMLWRLTGARTRYEGWVGKDSPTKRSRRNGCYVETDFLWCFEGPVWSRLIFSVICNNCEAKHLSHKTNPSMRYRILNI